MGIGAVYIELAIYHTKLILTHGIQSDNIRYLVPNSKIEQSDVNLSEVVMKYKKRWIY